MSATEQNPTRIFSRCPSCRNDTLTLNKGHLLCTWHDCKDPTLIDRVGDEPTMFNVTQVGVTAAIRDARGHILLGMKGRAFSPEFKQKWVTPGGRLCYGERIEHGLRREIREETGLEVRIVRPLAPQEIIHDKAHFVFYAFECEPVGGELLAGDDITEVRWFSPIELFTLSSMNITELTKDVIKSL